MSPFLAFFTISLELAHRTDSVQRTNFNKMAITAKKEDEVKIQNHCTKKIRMWHHTVDLRLVKVLSIWII